MKTRLLYPMSTSFALEVTQAGPANPYLSLQALT